MADLGHLRSFLAIYRAGTLTRATRLVHLTQPALSQQLRSLEVHLGRRLFTRLPRGLEPTPAAHDLAAAIGPHLDALGAIAEDARVGAERIAGSITLGGPAELLGKRVVGMLAPLVERGLTTRLRFGLPPELIDELAAGDLDLVIATTRVPRRGIDFERFYTEELILVAGRGWAARLPRKLFEQHGARALDGVPLVAYTDELPIIRRYYRTVFGVRSTTRARVIAPDLRAVMHAVIAGAGVSVLPRYLSSDFLARGELIEIGPPGVPPTNTLYLATRGTVRRHPRVDLVAELLRRAATGW
jgi:DNA-binding transcriptional LysR family regulator